jgi:hypothetical protein
MESKPLLYLGTGDSDDHQRVRSHVLAFFGFSSLGRDAPPIEWIHPIARAGDASPIAGLRILEIPPNEKSRLWTYCTIGAFTQAHPTSGLLEFFLLTHRRETERSVELMTMLAGYQPREILGFGHTVPIGEPWLPKSSCTEFLISLPYPFGPDLELCVSSERHVHIAWALPITKAESSFAKTHSLEELERRFEGAGLRYWEEERASVV